METISDSAIVKYDFSEKYFQILPEGRIRRRQYIGRMVWGGILFALLIGLAFWIISTNNPVIVFAGNTAFFVGGFIMWYVLNTKRIRDIGKDPKVVQKITIWLIIWNVIFSMYQFLWDQGWLPWYVSQFQKMLMNMGNTIDPANASTLDFPWHQILMEYSVYPYGIVVLLVFLYLFLVPGKTGDNEFGKDPINTKLGFFG